MSPVTKPCPKCKDAMTFLTSSAATYWVCNGCGHTERREE